MFVQLSILFCYDIDLRWFRHGNGKDTCGDSGECVGLLSVMCVSCAIVVTILL